MTDSMEEHEGREPEATEAVEAAQPEIEAAESALSAEAAEPAQAEVQVPEAQPESEPVTDAAPVAPMEAARSLELSDDEVGRLAEGVAAEVVAPSVSQMIPSPAEPVAESEPPPADEPDDGRRWYVVHCYSGYENKVRHNLEQRIESMGMKGKIFDVVVPTEEELEVRDGKRRTVERRVFPGYILVQMVMSEEPWYVVRNTPGVTGFVGMGNEPTPLRPEEVAQIVKRMEAEAPRVKVTFKTGQKVRIIDGPFNDFIGTVDALDMEKAKVRVMVSFFGRETPVELDFLQVEKA